jgi:hypothetical protein
MKQITKIVTALVVLLAVSACAQTSPSSRVFSEYNYAPTNGYNSYNVAADYNAPVEAYGYAVGDSVAPIALYPHH